MFMSPDIYLNVFFIITVLQVIFELKLSMNRYSDNYYYRKCYLKRDQVPTQTLMKNKMSPALAKVYFNSMSHKLKVLAGLEPPLKGGGNDWYTPPTEILKHKRYVLKPIKNEHRKKLGFNGIEFLGEKLVSDHFERMEKEKADVILESDINWKNTIVLTCRQHWEDMSKNAAVQNTAKIKRCFDEYTQIYRNSITKIELLLMDAAKNEFNQFKESMYKNLQLKYESMLHQQATSQYDKYSNRLQRNKDKLKQRFIDQVQNIRTNMGHRIHDINVEKHTAIEKLRHFLECQNMACQVYVALKERQEHQKDIEVSNRDYQKKIKDLSEKIAIKDFEIKLEQKKEAKRQEFNKIWKRKVCHIVKKFQLFVTYCLHNLPEHADFFINMEKLMLLQLNEVLEEPTVESLFVPDTMEFDDPVPQPHPFILFADKGFQPKIDESLCPMHCTSSSSQMPVIIINKRFIYSACDNYELFKEKVNRYISGERGGDTDFTDEDEDKYKYYVPVKNTTSQEILELKLESSLMQILQQEQPNIHKVDVKCCVCQIPHCFCSPLHAADFSTSPSPSAAVASHTSAVPTYSKLKSRYDELQHQRQPKWESFFDYIQSKNCRCANMAKKHLRENVPAYMRIMSTFDEPDLPHYEIVPVDVLKQMVKKAKGLKTPPSTPPKVASKTKDIGIQYSDQEFDLLCTCFSDDEFEKLCAEIMANKAIYGTNIAEKFQVVEGSVTPSHLGKTAESFATEQAFCLRNLLEGSPDLQEIFKNDDCALYK